MTLVAPYLAMTVQTTNHLLGLKPRSTHCNSLGMVWTLQVDSPYTGEVVFETGLMSPAQVNETISAARHAQRGWSRTSLEERIALCERWLVAFEDELERVSTELSQQMGKPINEARGEVRTALDRARQLIGLAPDALAVEALPEKEGFIREIHKAPVGVVLSIVAWNYPLLIAVNAVIPAVLAGNAVVVKASERAPGAGEIFSSTFTLSGAPDGLVQTVHSTHDVTSMLVRHPGIDHVVFTGSINGGRAVHRAAAGTLKPVATELGGKDAAYVRADADLDFTIPNLVEGACYNAGQSCCAIERVYVHRSLYAKVVDGVVEHARSLVMGDPLDESTSLGPIAQPHHPAALAALVASGIAAGGRLLLGGTTAKVDGKGRFFAPTVVSDAPQRSALMQEEAFGPIVALLPVDGDEQAITLMNDSRFGLTASIWTQDVDMARALFPRIEAGTVFMNRCDFLDPLLPWTGVKETGRGVSLSHHGYASMVRLKAAHFRTRKG